MMSELKRRIYSYYSIDTAIRPAEARLQAARNTTF
jgi:hypothetical protein